MKHLLLKFLTISLSTSVVLTSAQNAFSHSVEAPTHTRTPNQDITHKQQASKQITQASQTAQGFFVIGLFSSYILVGLKYKKHRDNKTVTLQQQIELLERIWKMKSHKKGNS
ncbi:MAG TPA: hypothetical protein V6C95_02555 [Coleofasciculaceae cyanobacterium]